ncbi:MAG: 3-phosphoshikimate 1-carboxyvinyltransferase [Vicingus serpentipes]|nr:3-phosphoshikimate 1-carboxyvinyltransferase [Vicingus serpentipes]
MSIRLFHPTQHIEGTINLTSSKSESNRVLIIQALCDTSFGINNLAAAKDTQTLQQLLISSEKTLDVGHAGTVMRFLTAYLSLQEEEHTITGSSRMKERPIKVLVDALRTLGAEIDYLENEGFPPLKIRGYQMEGGTISIDGSVSSQYVSALLLIAPQLQSGLTIEFKGEIISKPYINMTLSIMNYFGAQTSWSNNNIVVKNGKYQAKEITVEADWSSASYWYGIAALSKTTTINLLGLKKDSLQGDAALYKIYENFGVKTTWINGGICLTKTDNCVTSFNYNFEDCPDIAQTVAVTCAALNINSQLTGLKTLRIKETDRVFALQTELNQLGYHVTVEDNDILIRSSSALVMPNIHPIKTYDDHRMAMAFAPLALINATQIENEDVVIKSYPDFWKDLQQVGFTID